MQIAQWLAPARADQGAPNFEVLPCTVRRAALVSDAVVASFQNSACNVISRRTFPKCARDSRHYADGRRYVSHAPYRRYHLHSITVMCLSYQWMLSSSFQLHGVRVRLGCRQHSWRRLRAPDERLKLTALTVQACSAKHRAR